MRYERNVRAVRRALQIHRRRFDERLHGTRYLLRETIFYEWECLRGCGKWQAPMFISLVAKNSGQKDWTYEHAIPLSLVFKQLEKLGGNPSLQAIRDVLEKWDIPVIVTKRESAKLKKKNLASKMPLGWPGPEKPFARYGYCGISLDKNQTL
jgi:hypothetical protein